MIKLNLGQAQMAVGQQKDWAYGALDCIATRQVNDALRKKMHPADERTRRVYMAIQNPAMAMTLQGMKVDEVARQKAVKDLQAEIGEVHEQLVANPEIVEIWDRTEKETGTCEKSTRKDGKHTWTKGVPDGPDRRCENCGKSRMIVRPFNPGSDHDLKHLLYDLWGLPPKFNHKTGTVTTDKEARDSLRRRYKKHADILTLIDKWTELDKQLQFLAFKTTPNGRFMSAFNVGVTSTGRWSSNKDHFGFGANAQNVTERHRHIFIPDPGYEFCYADLKQAESNVIAHVAGDEQYIEAHLGGDTHTFVTRLVWPEGFDGQQWTGDISLDKEIAKNNYPEWDNRPGHDYRFQSKSIQHGTNLGRTAYGIARKQHIPVEAAKSSQQRYFRAFPGVKQNYHVMIKEKVVNQEYIVTPLGVRFKLLGRPDDDGTWREGLAAIPQATVGHLIGIGCWLIQRDLPEIVLVAQVHDAVLFQFPKGRYDLVYKALDLMAIPVPILGGDGVERVMTIGTEAAIGMNWGHYNDKEAKGPLNLTGLREIEFASPTEWSMH